MIGNFKRGHGKQGHIYIGKLGEEIARKYLEKHGFRIIARNDRTRYSELDLICEKDGVTIFVEVRTKIGTLFGLPEETITKEKLTRLRRAAEAYLARTNSLKPCRVDAICIILKENTTVERVNHYENIAG
jgi:putative endonuclease